MKAKRKKLESRKTKQNTITMLDYIRFTGVRNFFLLWFCWRDQNVKCYIKGNNINLLMSLLAEKIHQLSNKSMFNFQRRSWLNVKKQKKKKKLMTEKWYQIGRLDQFQSLGLNYPLTLLIVIGLFLTIYLYIVYIYLFYMWIFYFYIWKMHMHLYTHTCKHAQMLNFYSKWHLHWSS